MLKRRKENEIRWKCYVVVGTLDGKIGLGIRCSKDKTKAFQRATRSAKRNMITIAKGTYSRGDSGNHHTVQRPTIGRYGSQRIELDPAPRGTGIAHPMARAMFKVAGIDDCIIRSSMEESLPLGSIASGLFHALKTLKIRRL